jgi:membrane protein implicated in regulation of membrane protease activity
MRRAALRYAAGRLGLFVLMAALVWLGGQALGRDVNGLELLLVAFALSSVLGIWLFSRQRRELAEALDAQRKAKAEQVAARRARLDQEK